VRELEALASGPDGWTGTAADAAANPHRMAIRTAQGMLLVSLDDIEWIEARGDYVRVHSAGRVDLVRETISGFEHRQGEGDQTAA